MGKFARFRLTGSEIQRIAAMEYRPLESAGAD